jgi:hypothetical protein
VKHYLLYRLGGLEVTQANGNQEVTQANGNQEVIQDMIKDNGNYLLANNSDKLRKSMTIAKFMNNKTIQKA